METPPVKSSGDADGSFVKKLKEFDGLAMSIGNGNVNSNEHGSDRKLTESEETEDSSDGSNGVTAGDFKNSKKRSRQESPSSGDGKDQKKSNTVEISCGSAKPVDGITPGNLPRKNGENPKTTLALKEPSDLNAKSSQTNLSQASMPSDNWLQNERELKRERRKQSNRESARRSRLRKQAEAEDLSAKVQILTAENMTLKSERNKLVETSERLRLENAKLMEKLGNARLVETGVNIHKIDDLRLKPIGTVNLLSRVNNSESSDTSNEDGASYEERNHGTKLHQLMDASPRTDAVAAG